MDGTRDTQRLRRLAEILAGSPSRRADSHESDQATRHLASIPVDRIRQLTLELQSREIVENDEIDSVAVRVLLNEYSAAVARLREVARLAGERIDAAVQPVAAVRTFVAQEAKLHARDLAEIDRRERPVTGGEQTAAPLA